MLQIHVDMVSCRTKNDRLFCHGIHGGSDDLRVFHEVIDADEFIRLVLPDFVTGENGTEGQNVWQGLGIGAAADAFCITLKTGLFMLDVQQCTHQLASGI